MNKRRLAGIARWLERGAPHKKHAVEFNMSAGIRLKRLCETGKESLACGTACCIAGAAIQFYNDPAALVQNAIDENGVTSENEVVWSRIYREAKTLLGLNADTADALFIPLQPFGKITPKWAARVIRKLIATGEVDWAGCRE